MNMPSFSALFESCIETPLYYIIYYLSWENAFVGPHSTNTYGKIGLTILIFTILLFTISYGVSGILASIYGIYDNLSDSAPSSDNAKKRSHYISEQIAQFFTDTKKVFGQEIPTVQYTIPVISLNSDGNIDLDSYDTSYNLLNHDAYNNAFFKKYQESMISMATIQILGFMLLFFSLIMITLTSSILLDKPGYHFHEK